MFKLFLHIARNTENHLERRHARLQDSAQRLLTDTQEHRDFLQDTMIELQHRMARTTSVMEAAAKIVP